MLNQSQLAQTREWVKDCQWGENFEEDEIDALPASQIEKGIEKHYDGGLKAFINDCEPCLN